MWMFGAETKMREKKKNHRLVKDIREKKEKQKRAKKQQHHKSKDSPTPLLD